MDLNNFSGEFNSALGKERNSVPESENKSLLMSIKCGLTALTLLIAAQTAFMFPVYLTDIAPIDVTRNGGHKTRTTNKWLFVSTKLRTFCNSLCSI